MDVLYPTRHIKMREFSGKLPIDGGLEIKEHKIEVIGIESQVSCYVVHIDMQ